MKLISWNINGIRAVIKKDFHKYLEREKPEVLCLQEIKIAESARAKEEFDFPDYEEFWNSAERPGYSGTMTLVRHGILASYVPRFDWDNEGRIQILEFDKFYLANIYFPNANHELSRLDFKIDFSDKLLKEIKKLETNKPFLVCGDYNVAHNEIDLARPKDNIGSPGFTYEERDWMTKFLDNGFIDTFRAMNPEKIQYSWWSYRAGARARNVGWRIDYFCVSEKLMKNVKNVFISDEVLGSDHCPVGVVLDL
jgi:exodeoxyribonuclease III